MIKFVTSNEHKYRELRGIFSHHDIEIEWVRMKYEEIQADTTEEISLDSCRKLQPVIEGTFFMEDTGLYIPALKGFPGPYSSYVNSTIGNKGILSLLGGDRRAYFQTVISLSYRMNIYQFSSTLRGSISTEERGKNGFGFDPVFIPDGEKLTLAEMDPERKNTISHRRKAAEKLIDFIKSRNELNNE
ncbi:MAG: RdgB/HAM1 family non-canonical purine NTP pyrophosphatase [Thermoplasmataceae archaeon]